MDRSEIRAAFDDVLDQALVLHGFADYLRDYDVFAYSAADPRTGVAPEYLRYRFKHCVHTVAASAVPPEVRKRSLDQRLVDDEHGPDLDGYVWGVRWQAPHPGMKLVRDSVVAERWSRDLDLPFHEAVIETNGHHIGLVFTDLVVAPVDLGYAPFAVSDAGSGSTTQPP